LFHVNDNPDRPKEDRQNVDFVYLVKVGSGLFKENNEISAAGWFDKDSLPSEEEFAFDHRTTLLKFFEYQHHSFPLPLVGKL
jgi:8-oxo-dGTP diphosphatase